MEMIDKRTIEFLEERKKESNLKLEDGADAYYIVGSLYFLLDLAIAELKKVNERNEK